jgi:hypothetical protein
MIMKKKQRPGPKRAVEPVKKKYVGCIVNTKKLLRVQIVELLLSRFSWFRIFFFLKHLQN